MRGDLRAVVRAILTRPRGARRAQDRSRLTASSPSPCSTSRRWRAASAARTDGVFFRLASQALGQFVFYRAVGLQLLPARLRRPGHGAPRVPSSASRPRPPRSTAPTSPTAWSSPARSPRTRRCTARRARSSTSRAYQAVAGDAGALADRLDRNLLARHACPPAMRSAIVVGRERDSRHRHPQPRAHRGLPRRAPRPNTRWSDETRSPRSSSRRAGALSAGGLAAWRRRALSSPSRQAQSARLQGARVRVPVRRHRRQQPRDPDRHRRATRNTRRCAPWSSGVNIAQARAAADPARGPRRRSACIRARRAPAAVRAGQARGPRQRGHAQRAHDEAPNYFAEAPRQPLLALRPAAQWQSSVSSGAERARAGAGASPTRWRRSNAQLPRRDLDRGHQPLRHRRRPRARWRCPPPAASRCRASTTRAASQRAARRAASRSSPPTATTPT